jgi:hypothetical protein
VPRYGRLGSGRSLGSGPGWLVHQGAHLLFVQGLTGSKVGFRCGDALLGSGVGEQFQGGLDGLEIFSGEEHDVFAAVAGDVEALVRAPAGDSAPLSNYQFDLLKATSACRGSISRGTGQLGQAKGKNSADCPPLSPYSALGALRQDPGGAAESPDEASTCGNQDSRSTGARGCAPPDRAEQLAEMQPQ